MVGILSIESCRNMTIIIIKQVFKQSFIYTQPGLS